MQNCIGDKDLDSYVIFFFLTTPTKTKELLS